MAGSPTLSDELSTVAMNIDEPGRLVDFIASSLPSLSTPDKQDTLETTDIRARLEKINQHLAKELEVQQLRNKIQSEVQDRVQQTQREYYLREHMRQIQKELGEGDAQGLAAAGHASSNDRDRLNSNVSESSLRMDSRDPGGSPAQIPLFAELPAARRSAGAFAERLEREHAEAAAIAARIPRHVRFGTSSWSFPGWEGLVFSRKASAASLARDGLSEYARHPLLTTVGIDRGFYAPIPREDLARYAQQLPPGFPCCAKAPESVTGAALLAAAIVVAVTVLRPEAGVPAEARDASGATDREEAA